MNSELHKLSTNTFDKQDASIPCGSGVCAAKVLEMSDVAGFMGSRSVPRPAVYGANDRLVQFRYDAPAKASEAEDHK